MFLDLQLNRAGPSPSALARRGVHVIEQAAVARRPGAVARRPFLVAPLELQLQVIVRERSFRSELAEHFARNLDRGAPIDIADHGEDLERVATGPDRFGVVRTRVLRQPSHVRTWLWPPHPRSPTVEILAVPERSPASLSMGRDGEQED